jgi:hypothetical protein
MLHVVLVTLCMHTGVYVHAVFGICSHALFGAFVAYCTQSCHRLLTYIPLASHFALQLGFVEGCVARTFEVMAKLGVCPKTAAMGLQGCAVNAAQCRAIMQLQSEQQLALPRML